jgi:hypothetical protein
MEAKGNERRSRDGSAFGTADAPSTAEQPADGRDSFESVRAVVCARGSVSSCSSEFDRSADLSAVVAGATFDAAACTSVDTVTATACASPGTGCASGCSCFEVESVMSIRLAGFSSGPGKVLP